MALLLGLALLLSVAYILKVPYLYPYARWAKESIMAEGLTEKSLPNPLPNQRFADTWGAARSFGRKHEGVDIFAKRGTPIKSTTSGVVIKVGHNRLGGKVVSVLAPNRVVHYYAHLDEFADIKRHQWIEAGTVIGTVGDTGNAKGTPPHLHYGIYTSMGAINPFPLIVQ